MAFTIYADQFTSSEIDPTQLRYHYHAQKSPLRGQLVAGSLHQGNAPQDGRWMDVTDVDIDLRERYFVQYTNNNTLVPGSLIQATHLPPGQWKEVKKARTLFHRVVFTDPYPVSYFSFEGSPPSTTSVVSQDNFINNRVTPALTALYPEIPEFIPQGLLFKLPYGKHLHFNIYYYKGTFATLNRDVSKLVPLANGNSFWLADSSNVPQPNTNIGAWVITTNSLKATSAAENGLYCFVLEMLDLPSGRTEYIVLENVLESTNIIMPSIPDDPSPEGGNDL